MGFSNGQVLAELRQVRLRQIPWVKHPIVFSKLRTLDLLTTAHQRSSAASGRPDVEIAALSERGQVEFERLSRQEEDANWAEYARSPYSAAGRIDLGPGRG